MFIFRLLKGIGELIAYAIAVPIILLGMLWSAMFNFILMLLSKIR